MPLLRDNNKMQLVASATLQDRRAHAASGFSPDGHVQAGITQGKHGNALSFSACVTLSKSPKLAGPLLTALWADPQGPAAQTLAPVSARSAGEHHTRPTGCTAICTSLSLPRTFFFLNATPILIGATTCHLACCSRTPAQATPRTLL